MSNRFGLGARFSQIKDTTKPKWSIYYDIEAEKFKKQQHLKVVQIGPLITDEEKATALIEFIEQSELMPYIKEQFKIKV